MQKLVLLVLFLLTISSAFAQEFVIELNLKSGSQYTRSYFSCATIEENINGTPFVMNWITNEATTFSVVGINNDGYIIDVTYNCFDYTMFINGTDIELQNESLGKKSSRNYTQKIIGIPCRLIISKKGRVLEFDSELLLNKMIENENDISPEYVSQMKSIFTKDAFKGQMEIAWAFFPENPVKLKSKWEVSTQINSTFIADINNIYQLIEITDSSYTIVGKGKIKTIPSDNFTVLGNMAIQYDLKGTIESKTIVDKETGWVVQANYYQKMEGTATIMKNGILPAGTIIPISLTQELIETK
ncbi:MAG: hypothetical protein CVU11_01350 [Bacteroidetes bacterium HGW-Bacteroidetes-6]|jgi:hypothetical protein|nr:MAG: hypothetical protein CVU11_01350 [Bacteroidetes bacterium HGW-Bacteroidetes-6]